MQVQRAYQYAMVLPHGIFYHMNSSHVQNAIFFSDSTVKYAS